MIHEAAVGDDVRMKVPWTIARLHAFHSIFRGLLALVRVRIDLLLASEVLL
jgi:hypothetical protein